jgi:hypothetical protein
MVLFPNEKSSCHEKTVTVAMSSPKRLKANIRMAANIPDMKMDKKELHASGIVLTR